MHYISWQWRWGGECSAPVPGHITLSGKSLHPHCTWLFLIPTWVLDLYSEWSSISAGSLISFYWLSNLPSSHCSHWVMHKGFNLLRCDIPSLCECLPKYLRKVSPSSYMPQGLRFFRNVVVHLPGYCSLHFTKPKSLLHRYVSLKIEIFQLRERNIYFIILEIFFISFWNTLLWIIILFYRSFALKRTRRPDFFIINFVTNKTK